MWNLYYRFSPAAQGHGFAAEMVKAACDAAADLRPDLPLVASVLAHNRSSQATALRAGLEQVWRGPETQMSARSGLFTPTGRCLTASSRPSRGLT
jgi:RimJ/RimL family protein N-acetyltransferase